MNNLQYTLKYVVIFLFLLPLNVIMAQKVKVKVLVWNILSFEKEDKSGETTGFPVDDFVTFMNNENPDIILLNEFETGTSRMGKEKMAELASRFGMFPYYIMSYPKDVGFYGNVILTKYPVVKTASKLMSYQHSKGEGNYQWNDGRFLTTYGADQRSLGYADILIPTSDSNGEIIRVVTSHFDHQGNNSVRTNQSKESVSFAELDNPKYPTIFGGDFNSSSTSVLAPILEIGDHVGYSWVDHIITYPKGKWKTEEFKKITAGNLSDHDAICATLSYN